MNNDSTLCTAPEPAAPTLIDLVNQVRAARSTLALPTRLLEGLLWGSPGTKPPAVLGAEPVCLLLQQLEQLLEQAEATAVALEGQALEAAQQHPV